MTWMIIAILIIVVYFAKLWYARKLKKIRDSQDFTTEEGKKMIEAINFKLDRINGYRIYK